MTRLDSLDVHLDTHPLPSVDRDRLTLAEYTDADTGEMTTQHLVRGHDIDLHGFNGLKASETGVSLRLSGKALGNRYTDGVSLDTVEELCDRLTATGLITLTPTDLLGGTVRRADPFTDVLTDDLDGVPDALRLIGRTFGQGARTKGKGDAVTLYRTLPDAQGEYRIYSKGLELSRARHADFCKLYPAAAASVNGRHRLEVEARSYHALRRVAGLAKGSVTVSDVLNATGSPVADALDSMLSTWTGRRRALHSLPTVPQTIDSLLSLPSASPSADALALLGALVAELTGGDYVASQEVVRARYGSKHAHRIYPALRAACEAYRSPQDLDLHADAVNVLRVVSDRVRQREAA